MRRLLLAAAAGALVLAGAGCSSGSAALTSQDYESCAEFTRVLNEWGTDYGAELGAVGEAIAAGDDQRQQTSVAVVRELFSDSADRLRTQAGQASYEELAEALGEAADGLAEIADQIETYDDVTTAPELMSDGQFAVAGERVNVICAD